MEEASGLTTDSFASSLHGNGPDGDRRAARPATIAASGRQARRATGPRVRQRTKAIVVTLSRFQPMPLRNAAA
jgi:hypothetical protein